MQHKQNVISKVECKKVPYLDMRLSWDDKTNELQFKIHLKPDQHLKYLNLGSEHQHSCFRSIPWGVFYRACKLTSRTSKNLVKRINKIYPLHAKALRKTNLTTEFPTMENFLEEMETKNKKRNDNVNMNSKDQLLDNNNPQTKDQSNSIIKKNNWQTNFCIGFLDV